MKNSRRISKAGRLGQAGALLLILSASDALAESAFKSDWIRQLGTASSESACGVATDGRGNVYISGSTAGVLDKTNYGSLDAFVSKYDVQGNLLWTRQLGTTEEDQSRGVSADGLGNVYISGFTAGSLGGPNAGGHDAFVSKYDADGNLLWTRQLGTSEDDESHGVSADGLGNVYISGDTYGVLDGGRSGSADIFVSKYDAQGNLLWTRQLGTSEGDHSLGMAADGLGHVYICGYTNGSLDETHAAGRFDAFVCKYDAEGNLLWTRQHAESDRAQSNGVSADRLGNVFISGSGEMYEDRPDIKVIHHHAFVSKYNAAGELVWTRQMRARAWIESTSVSADGLGNVYISGSTSDSLQGSNVGAFVSKYDATGNLLWTQQLGTTQGDSSRGVAADPSGNVFIAGGTLGSLGGPNAGGDDAFVIKLTPAGGPPIWVVAPIAIVIVLGLRFVMGRFN